MSKVRKLAKRTDFQIDLGGNPTCTQWCDLKAIFFVCKMMIIIATSQDPVEVEMG